MTVQIVTPDGLIYDHVAFVSVKTIDGEMGVCSPYQYNYCLEVDQVKGTQNR